MSIIKKFFPEYKSKADLKQQIAYLEGRNTPQAMSSIRFEDDMIEVGASVLLDRDRPERARYTKRELHELLMREIEPFISYDYQDSRDTPYQCLIGRVYVSQGRNREKKEMGRMTKYKETQIIKHALAQYLKRPEATDDERADEQLILDKYTEKALSFQRQYNIVPKRREGQA